MVQSDMVLRAIDAVVGWADGGTGERAEAALVGATRILAGNSLSVEGMHLKGVALHFLERCGVRKRDIEQKLLAELPRTENLGKAAPKAKLGNTCGVVREHPANDSITVFVIEYDDETERSHIVNNSLSHTLTL